MKVLDGVKVAVGTAVLVRVTVGVLLGVRAGEQFSITALGLLLPGCPGR